MTGIVKTVYLANGITATEMERLVDQINKHKTQVERGVLKNPHSLVLTGNYPQTITKVTVTDSKELSLADFIRELVFETEGGNVESPFLQDLKNTATTIETELERHFLNRED